MKNYAVDIDITMSVRLYVGAQNECDAERIAKEMAEKDCYSHLRNSSFVKSEIIEVIEDEDEDEPDIRDLGPAIDYVKSQMCAEDIEILHSQIRKNYRNHMPPSYGIDDGKIIDLLEEYGEDNGLPEGWWEEYGDIDDIVFLL